MQMELGDLQVKWRRSLRVHSCSDKQRTQVPVAGHRGEAAAAQWSEQGLFLRPPPDTGHVHLLPSFSNCFELNNILGPEPVFLQ